MTAIVHVRCRRPNPRHSALLRRVAAAALATSRTRDVELTIVLTDEAEIRRLNRRFGGSNHATDVLSFGAGHRDPESGLTYLGDVVISLPKAKVQARLGGHALSDELRLLCVHGVLHLLGYDHGDPARKARMWSVQTRVLHSLGSRITSPARVNR